MNRKRLRDLAEGLKEELEVDEFKFGVYYVNEFNTCHTKGCAIGHLAATGKAGWGLTEGGRIEYYNKEGDLVADERTAGCMYFDIPKYLYKFLFIPHSSPSLEYDIGRKFGFIETTGRATAKDVANNLEHVIQMDEDQLKKFKSALKRTSVLS